MMDADAPKIEVVIVQKQTINVREDAIERLARLLCKADGNDPDSDRRVSADGTSMISVHWTYPTNLGWYPYRDRAIELLEKAFAK